MHKLMVFAMMAALAALTGCGGVKTVKTEDGKTLVVGPTSNYQEYLAADRAARASDRQVKADVEAAKFTAASDCAKSSDVSGCMLGLVALGGAGAARAEAPAIAPPPREATGMEKFAQFMGAMSPIMGTAITGMVQMKQASYARDTARDQYQMLSDIVGSSTTAMGNVAQSAVVNAKPNITVGGDYVQGDGNTVVRGHVGDTVGRDQISGTQYQGPVVGRDLLVIGRDQVQNSHIGDNDRNDSPGPYEGPYCTGTGCQPQPEPNP